MGGKALKSYGIITERKSTIEHESIQSEIIIKLKKLFPNTEFDTVKYYRNKNSHGDADILVKNKGQLKEINKILEINFGKVHYNGNVYSFEYKKYQIDFILINEKYWKSRYFFDYDPIGNLIGRLSHKFGLKYGFQGLVYPYRGYSGNMVKDILISQDIEKIFDFMNFNYSRYQKGFDTLEEIFEWIIDSKYFSSEIFEFKNLTALDRHRNKKRKTYNDFLNYINKNKIKKSYTFNKKDYYIDIIDNFFPDSKLKKQLETLDLKNLKLKEANSIFNGNLVMKWTNLKNKELGNVISSFKKYLVDNYEDDYSDIIINNKENIKEIFDKWYKNINLK